MLELIYIDTKRGGDEFFASLFAIGRSELLIKIDT